MSIKIPSAKPALRFEGDAAVYSVPSESEDIHHYVIAFADGDFACSCRGFQYNQKCWHVKVLRGED